MGEDLPENIFYENIAQILNLARENAKTAVNITMVYAYYEIGRTIVEEEQNGKFGRNMVKGCCKVCQSISQKNLERDFLLVI